MEREVKKGHREGKEASAERFQAPGVQFYKGASVSLLSDPRDKGAGCPSTALSIG